MRVSAILGAHPSHPAHSDHTGWANEEIIRFWQRPASLSGQILIGNWGLSSWPCSQFSISQSRALLPPAWPDIVILVSPDSDVNYLSIWTQVRRRRGPRPQVTQPPVLVWSALVIITHITITARCFPDITRVSSARLGDKTRRRRNIATSLNIITSIETMRILRHLRSEEPGSEFVYQPWVVPALWSEQTQTWVSCHWITRSMGRCWLLASCL